jgi:hypothetical protein
MSASFLSSVKQFLLLILHLFLTVVMGLTAWAFWGLYGEEKLTNQYQQEGEPKMVTVTDFNTVKQRWTDYLGNVEYISFVYNGKMYTARYVQHPTYVSRGDKVALLYHRQMDAFRQPEKQLDFAVTNKSKLVGWTSVSLFSTEHRWLAACLAVSVAFFFLLVGLLARIPGLGFLTSVGSFVFIVLLLAGVGYVTYNAVVYYRYYHQIKDSGEQVTVQLLNKDRYQLIRNNSRTAIRFYGYKASVSFRNGERTIPISKHDFETLQKGSLLTAYYNASADDMMAADYPMDYMVFCFAGIVWLLLLYAMGKRMGRMRKKRMVS